jgi:MFS family permease
MKDDFEFYFNLLYSVYSLPNIFLPFLGGLLIRKLGNNMMFFIFALFIASGQLLFAYGCDSQSMTIMLIGRAIFGVGGECIGLSLTGIIVKWYVKSEIGLPLGLSISLGRLGSVINASFSPSMSNV